VVRSRGEERESGNGRKKEEERWQSVRSKLILQKLWEKKTPAQQSPAWQKAGKKNVKGG